MSGEFMEETRRVLRVRARGRCEMCGVPLLSSQIHHRQPRGMGGSSEGATSDPSNGLVLHPSCHAKVESYRETAYLNGWLVAKGTDPAGVPVKTWAGWRLLGDGYTAATDPQLDAEVDCS